MKLYNKIKKNYNLLNLELITFRAYLGLNKIYVFYLNCKYIKGFRNNFSVFELLYTKIHLKKVLKIIYKYNISKKKIFFIGFDDNNGFTNYKTLFLKTKHFFISDFWVHNLLLNKALVLDHFKKTLSSKKKINSNMIDELFNILETPDLIISVNNNNFELYKEIIKLKLPLISLFNNSSKVRFLGYKIYGNFESVKAKIFIYLLFKALLSFSNINEKTKKL